MLKTKKIVKSPVKENLDENYTSNTIRYYNTQGSISKDYMDAVFDGLHMNPCHKVEITEKIKEYVDISRINAEDIEELPFEISKNDFKKSIETYLYSVLNSIQKSISNKTTLYIYNLNSDKDYDVMKYECIEEYANFKFELEPSKKTTKDIDKIVSEISQAVTDEDYSICRYFYIIIPEETLGVRVPFTNRCEKLYKSDFNVEKNSDLLQKIIADLEKKKVFELEEITKKEENQTTLTDLKTLLNELSEFLSEVSKKNKEEDITNEDIRKLSNKGKEFEYVLERLKVVKG